MSDATTYMQLALEEARKGLGRTRPNPAVGALVVRDGEIVGRGFHPAAGQPHAEIFALREAGTKAFGATIYVTLEPCSHQGRTGPCANALIEAGLKKVVVGTVDPNPLVAGRGLEMLRQAGLVVETGACAEECRELIAPFAWHVVHGVPLTLYKAAMTFDGQLATANGDSRWVSCEESRHQVHLLRNRVDAIMVGVQTVVADDPQLTTRLPSGGRDPLRVIVDSRLRLPRTCRVIQQPSAARTLIATTDQADTQACAELQRSGCEVLILPSDSGRVSLPTLWQELGRRNIQYLLLEGGRTLAASALQAGLINRLQLYLAPKLVGGQGLSGLFAAAGCERMSQALALEKMCAQQVGTDIFLTAEVKSCLPD